MEEFNIKVLQGRISKVLNQNFTMESERLSLSQSIKVTRTTIDRWRSQSLLPKISSIANLALLLNLSIDSIVFEEQKSVNFTNSIYNEKELQERICNVLFLHSKSSYQLAKTLEVSHSTIGLWKKKLSIPNLFKISLLSKELSKSLDYLILGYK